MMRQATSILILGLLTWSGPLSPRAMAGQLPSDVHPASLSRLAPLEPTTLGPDRLGRVDDMAGDTTQVGSEPAAAIARLHGSGTNLRWDAPMGRRLTELTILATAREIDQPYEWALHELEALAVGVDAAVIDVVRHRGPVTALPDREAVVVELARELLTTRRLGADTYARALATLGTTNLVDVVDVIGRYVSTGATLTAFNQQMPAGWRQSLPLPFTPPDDVHPDSRSRLPLRGPGSETSVSILYGRMLSPSGIGPGHLRSYGAGLSTLDARVGTRLTQLATLVTARVHDAQYVWTLHEPLAAAGGVERELIEIVRDRRPLPAGLAERDAVVVALGRELLRDYNVSRETYARALRAFGEENLVDLVALMGAHAADAVVLAAFDQHLPEGQVSLLP